MIDGARARSILSCVFAVVLLTTGCSPRPDLHDEFDDIARGRSTRTVRVALIAVEDLRAEDVDAALRANPSLRPPDVVRPAAWASGTGIEAVASAISGRPAIEYVRSPQRPLPPIGDLGPWTRGVSSSLRSRYGFDTIFGNERGVHPVVRIGDVTDTSLPRGTQVQLVMLDADTDIGSVLGLVTHWADGIDPRWHVKLFGFPGSVEDPAQDLRVPVYDWSPDGANDTVVVEEVRGLPRALWGMADREFVWAAWPGRGDREGGVFATDGTLSMWSDPEGFVFAADDPTVDTPAARDALSGRLATELFGGTPRAWIAVRGSEVVDFVDLSLFGHMPLTGRLEAWALEDIDTRWDPNENSARYSLGAEDLGDGVVLDLGWPPFQFEVRITGEFADGPWLGPPVHLGLDARSWGFRALRVAPFSRAFWLASSGWPEDAATWWPDAPVGVHVGIRGTADTPVPAVLEENSR